MNRKKIIFASVPALIIAVALIIMFSKNKQQSVDNNSPAYRCYPVMGTWAELTLYGSKNVTELAFRKIRKVFNDVNKVCNRFNKQSELSRLNSSAAERPFKCSNLLWKILIDSKFFYELSDGTFDVTVTPLMELWGFYRKQNKIPSEFLIKKTLKQVGLDKVKYNKKNHTVFYTEKGIQIDLGGIAKGYAVDLAFESVKKLNLKGGIINLGGNIRTFPSSPPGRKNYSIGIRDPFDKNKIMGGTVKILNSSIATSGDYERFVIIKGERFTHIINPLTGYPVKGMAAVTVICKSALWADAISTSVFLNGKHFAKKIHENYPGVDMLIIQGYKNLPQTISINTYGRIWKQINNILPEYKDKEKK